MSSEPRFKRSIPASVAAFVLFTLAAFLPLHSHAQINGAPASVTSPGFGGRAINGPPSGVTSIGPQGYGNGQFQSRFNGNPNTTVDYDFNSDVSRHRHHNRDGNGGPNSAVDYNFNSDVLPHRHHDRDGNDNSRGYIPYYTYAFPVPYAVDMGSEPQDEEAAPPEPDEPYQGGPTVFDRRGYGERSYVPVLREAPPARRAERAEEPSAPAAAPAPAPVEPLEPTTLVFKDGHKLEVGNYAIVGQTLFDMTPGHARRVPLKDLDLEATRRVNDESGVTFQLPLGSRAN